MTVLAQAAGFAVLAGVSPTALLVMAVYLSTANPRTMALLYVAGAVIMTVTTGVALLVVIRFTGLRPGEKLDETLVSANEERTLTTHPKIWNSRSGVGLPPDFDCLLEQLYAASAVNNAPEVRRLLAVLVPGYVPSAGDPAVVVAPYPDDW